MPKVSDLFEIYDGNLNLINLDEDFDGVNFVGASRFNNNVTGKIRLYPEMQVFEAGCITVPADGNSQLYACVQDSEFITGQNVSVLVPKRDMLDIEKWFYCYCLRQNAAYFNFGRKANKYLKDIELPDRIPDWVYECKLDLPMTEVASDIPDLHTENWKAFRLGDLFDITKGTLDRIPDDLNDEGVTAIITSSDTNHGIAGYRDDLFLLSKSNCLTIAADGSVGASFYHTDNVVANAAVNILSNSVCNKYHYLFICSLIQKIRTRFSYGYKWSLSRMQDTEIKLPATPEGNPDWDFMESYIKSLPYSDLLNKI